MEVAARLPTNPEREEFFEQLRKRIVSFLVHRRGFRVDQAEDVAQNTVLTVLANPPKLKGGDEDLLPWCIGVARHLSSAKIRENLKTVQEPRLGWWMAAPDTQGEDTGHSDPVEELEIALREIEEQCKELLRRRINKEKSKTLAASLHISVPTLYVREHRCRQQLKRIILSGRDNSRKDL